jgi:hypothetical protein
MADNRKLTLGDLCGDALAVIRFHFPADGAPQI